jgi:UDP-glucose 6-dehydrogenase
MVPGFDREFGFGGMCLPKDTLAFATSASRKGSPLKLLEEAILINNQLR